tara:strand:- start:60907 stop:61593 length:687 start_codon:yes stop_codon:yes gene_type:complete
MMPVILQQNKPYYFCRSINYKNYTAMKRINIFFLLLFLIPVLGFAQTTETFDYVSPFHEGFSAVKSGNQWGFINKEGKLVIDFRDDLFATKIKDEAYPIFSNSRCIIFKKKDAISYFGYIDTSGKTIIPPTFLNASNYVNNIAIVLELDKEIAGHNDIMGKDIVYYTYREVVLNTKGKVIEKLTPPKNVVFDKIFFYEPLKITSKILSEKLVAFLNEQHKWQIKKLDK